MEYNMQLDFRARVGTMHIVNNGTTQFSTPIIPFQIEGVINCIDWLIITN